jgi:uncharacterized protein
MRIRQLLPSFSWIGLALVLTLVFPTIYEHTFAATSQIHQRTPAISSAYDQQPQAVASNSSLGRRYPATLIAREFIQRLEAKDLNGASQLLAQDVVFELPFQLPGNQSRYEGSSAFLAFLSDIFNTFSQVDFVNIRFYQTIDPNRVIVEAEGNFVVAATGAPYRNTYIIVCETNGRTLTTIREYNNPLVLAETFGIDLSP